MTTYDTKKWNINTGIVISSMKINNIPIYLFILDDRILIVKRKNLPNLYDYFKEHSKSLIFMTSEFKDDFSRAILSEDQTLDNKIKFLMSRKI